MPQISLKKIYGLELQSNSYTTREGSFEIASNYTLVQDDILKSRRGNFLFYDLAAVTGRTLTEYQAKLVGICSDRVQVYNQNSDGTLSSVSTLSGATVSIPSGTKARNLQANSNLYFTSANGIMKLESVTGNVLTAGIDSATDLQIFYQDFSVSESFFRPDSQIAYRILFGRKDANNNLVLSAPSQITFATNSTAAASSVSLPGGNTVRINTSAAHGLLATNTVYIENANGTGVPDGAYIVIAVGSATQFDISGTSPASVTALSWGTYKTTRLLYDIPDSVNSTEYITQIYRSTASAAATVSPDESTLQLVDEFNLTAAELSTGYVVYVDTTPDSLLGAFLYTNPNTGEVGGISQANTRPPYASDIAVFKGYTFYANVQTPFQLSLNLISSNTTTMPTGAKFITTSNATVRTYEGSTGVGNKTVRATSVGFVLAVVTITYNGHDLANGDIISVAEALDSSGTQLGTLPQGNYTVAGATANTFTITAPSTPTGLVALTFLGVSRVSTGNRLFWIDNTSSVSVAIDNTARSIARALNSDGSGAVNAFYVSGVEDVPGKMILRTKSYTQSFYMNAVTAAIADSFTPSIPTSGQAAISTRNSGIGMIYISKSNQPEAVPIANSITVGSRNAQILRIETLRDSLIIIKDDGIYRLNGNGITNFAVTILDSTVLCKSTGSVRTLNNEVYCLSTQGVVAISETSARIVSRPIEPLLTAVAGKSYLEAQTNAVGYDSERVYLLSTVSPQSVTADVVYCFNAITQCWTTWDTVFSDAIIKPSDDKLYFLDYGNQINEERKNQNRLDFSDFDFVTTILTTPTTTTATMSIAGAVASVGDIFVFNNIINRITAINTVAGVLVYTFARAFSFVAGNVGLLYQGISKTLRTSPLTAGDASVFKQFSEFSIEYRNPEAMSHIAISFLTDSVSGSVSTDWLALSQGDGWGLSPWGNFPWGLEEGININYFTSPCQPARTYVPLEASRGTYIQAELVHNAAAENIMIQTMAYTARVYGQRITR